MLQVITETSSSSNCTIRDVNPLEKIDFPTVQAEAKNVGLKNNYSEINLFRILYEVPIQFSYPTFYVILV